MRAALVKDGCAIALKEYKAKPKEICDEKFKERDQLAMADIYLALDKVVLFIVSECITTKGLQDKLETIYEEKSTSNRIFLQKQLYNIKMEKGFSLQQHLNDFTYIALNFKYYLKVSNSR